jgi:hypothetical protein
MALPFTVEQFYGVCRDDNATVWPEPWILVALALAATVVAPRPRSGSGMAVRAVGADHLGLPPGVLLPHQSCRRWLRGRLHRRCDRLLLARGWATQAHVPLGAEPEGDGVRDAHLLCPVGVPRLLGLRQASIPGDAHLRPAVPDDDFRHRSTGLRGAAHAAQHVDRSVAVVRHRGPGGLSPREVQPELGLIAAGLMGITLILPSGRPLRTQTS